MKKILGYIAVLLVFSWMTTANASVVATVSNSIGSLTIDGFSSSFGDNDQNTINFTFTYAVGTNVNVTQSIAHGESLNFAGSWYIPLAAIYKPSLASINVAFDLAGQNNVAASGVGSLTTLFSGLIPNPVYPNSTFTLDNTLLNITSATFGTIGTGAGAQATITLATTVISGTQLNTDLNALDGVITPPANGSITAAFTNGNITLAPEPTTMLLLSAGLLGFGFSRKRA